MRATELKTQLARLGWRVSESTMYQCGWYAWVPIGDRIDWPDCTSNEKPQSFCIEPYEIDHLDKVHSSAQFRVCGEVNPDQWVDLRVYGVPMNECIEAIPAATEILKAAWTAASQAVKKS